MKNYLILSLLLSAACTGVAPAPLDGGDAASDLTDGAALDAGAAGDAESDAAPVALDGETPDAGPVTDDAGDEAGALADAASDGDAASPDVSREDACARSAAAYLLTMCNADLVYCAFVDATIPEARVAACEADIAFSFSEGSGPADMPARCTRAVGAQSRCR